MGCLIILTEMRRSLDGWSVARSLRLLFLRRAFPARSRPYWEVYYRVTLKLLVEAHRARLLGSIGGSCLLAGGLLSGGDFVQGTFSMYVD